MLIAARGLTGDRQPFRRSEVAVESENDPIDGNGYVYALRDEEAYLQTDEDEKPEIMAEPPPDPSWLKCWFCRKSHQQVQRLYGAEYPVRDPNTFAVITLIFICDECVAKFAGWSAQESPKAPPIP
jgi:hypothetical protein